MMPGAQVRVNMVQAGQLRKCSLWQGNHVGHSGQLSPDYYHQCPCAYCHGSIDDAQWAVFGDDAYMVSRTIVQHYGGEWDPVYGVWIVYAMDVESAKRVVAILREEAALVKVINTKSSDPA
jgi:hypothetical protein